MVIKEDKLQKIPEGMYCYSIEHIQDNGIIKTVSCPYYTHRNSIEGFCTLIKLEVRDGCKECIF